MSNSNTLPLSRIPVSSGAPGSSSDRSDSESFPSGPVPSPLPDLNQDQQILSVNSLPPEWCKESGVVCFSYCGPSAMKIYLARKKNLSIYHVTDFQYPDPEQGRKLKFGCTLVGTKIYVLGVEDPLTCWVYDAADPGSVWVQGPPLCSRKHRPLIFSLAGSIYVLSLGFGSPGPGSFEVLKAGKKAWELADVPPCLTFQRWGVILGCSLHKDEKKIVIHVRREVGVYVCIYDAGSASWKVHSLRNNDPIDLPKMLGIGISQLCNSSFIMDQFCLHGVCNLGDVLGFDLLDFSNYMPRSWHIISLGLSSFFLLALYDDELVEDQLYVRIATFDVCLDSETSAPDTTIDLEGYRDFSLSLNESEGVLPLDSFHLGSQVCSCASFSYS